MADVVAQERGYFGGVLRDAGDAFVIPDDIWSDKKLRPSWVKLNTASVFGGKGDHDGDGNVGGSKPKGRKAKAETVDAPVAEPFADAPDPDTVKGNGITEALGGPAPDWIDHGKAGDQAGDQGDI